MALVGMLGLLGVSDPAAKPSPPEKQKVSESDSGDEALRLASTSSFSDMQIRVLQRLATQRAELKKKEEALALREATLKTAEATLQKRYDELEALREEIRTIYQAEEKKESERIKGMAKTICLNLKPSKAAQILEEMDDTLVLRMLPHVPDKTLSDILSRMKPEQAAILSQKYILTRTELPSAPGI